MSAIHKTVMDHLEKILTQALITNIGDTDPAFAGAVKLGPLQGNPEPDTARVSMTVHENDPDDRNRWHDRIVMVEIGNVITYARRFTVKGRCLLEDSRENLDRAREIASTVKNRAEVAILSEGWTGVAAEDGEYVSRGAVARSLRSHVRQGGGPPDSYDFRIAIQFEVWTTKGLT